MKRKLIDIIIILIVFILQVTLGPVIAIGGIAPNMLIILPVMLGYLNGCNEGIYVGVVSGLFYDLFSCNYLGFSSLVFAWAGFCSGLFYQKYEESQIIIPITATAIGNFVFGFLSYVGNFLLHNRLDISFFIGRFVIPEMLYTVIIAILFYKPLSKINPYLKSREKRSVTSFDERDI